MKAQQETLHTTIYRILFSYDRINSARRAGKTVDEIMTALNAQNITNSTVCATCGELIPQGCCTCGPYQKLQKNKGDLYGNYQM